MKEDKKFITAVSCIDGRVHEPIINFAKKHFKASYVDLITEPGPDKILSKNNNSQAVESIQNRILISLNKHNSKIVLVVGHYDCAANPADKDEHYKQIKESTSNLKKCNYDAEIYGLWINRDWKAELIL
jgi:hypothetical protein